MIVKEYKQSKTKQSKTKNKIMSEFKVISDIHLERMPSNTILDDTFLKKYLGEDISNLNNYYLILAGDIGNPYDKLYQDFLVLMTDKFKKVFLISGNHEYYTQYQNRKIYDFYEVEKKLSNLSLELNLENKLIYLNNSRYNDDELGDLVIIGSTLWSRIPREELTSEDVKLILYTDNDFHKIPYMGRKLTIANYNYLFEKSFQYLKEEIENVKREGKRCLIITHHTPLVEGCSHQKFLVKHNPANHCFSTNLEEIIKEPIVGWVYGHTHYSGNFQKNGVEMISNQVGNLYEVNQTYFDRERKWRF